MKPGDFRIVASLPAVCAVCAGRRRVWAVRSKKTWNCPHCFHWIPIWELPMRVDHKRGSAA